MNSHDSTCEHTAVEQLMLELVCMIPGAAADASAAHLKAGGSRVRARIALHAGSALGLARGQRIAVAAACELLHNASLVHDDLQDRDPERRGQASVWRSCGDAVAICAGDLLLSAAYAALSGSGVHAPRLIQRAYRQVAEVIRGQGEDLAQRGALPASLDAYEQVARGKSAPLLVLPLELALCLAGREDAVALAEEAGSLFAVGYQAADDLDDVERDALNEELNVVAVFARCGAKNPLDAARELAALRFEQARQAAERLPAGCGSILAEQAGRRALALRNRSVTA